MVLILWHIGVKAVNTAKDLSEKLSRAKHSHRCDATWPKHDQLCVDHLSKNPLVFTQDKTALMEEQLCLYFHFYICSLIGMVFLHACGSPAGNWPGAGPRACRASVCVVFTTTTSTLAIRGQRLVLWNVPMFKSLSQYQFTRNYFKAKHTMQMFVRWGNLLTEEAGKIRQFVWK